MLNKVLFSIEIENYLRFVIEEMVAVLISTFLIVVLGYIFFWKSVKSYINKRRDIITKEIQEAERNNLEAQEANQKADKNLKDSKSQAKELLANAEKRAKNEEENIISNAKETANRKLKQADIDIKQQEENAKSSMKEEIVSVAFEIAEKIVEKEIDQKKHKELVDNFIKGVDKDA